MKKLTLLAIVLTLSSSAFAAKDIDSEITDIKLRVTSGAKSKYSASFSMDYAGASLADPTGDLRPALGSESRPRAVSMRGNLGVRYRINKNESIAAGTGFSQTRPFHRSEDEKLEVSTPYLAYNNTLSIDEWQLGSNVRMYIYTEDYYRTQGMLGTVAYSLATMNNLGATKWSGGVAMDLSATAYDKKEEMYLSRQTNYGVSLIPSLQYNKSGRVNAYTSLTALSYNHMRSDKTLNMQSSDMTQTLGMGVAFTRDVYVTPFLTFEPTKFSSDRSTVNLSARINL